MKSFFNGIIKFKKDSALIVAVATCLVLVYIDQTGVGLTLEKIKNDFRLTDNSLQWIINSYTLTLSVSILICGKFGDIFGRKRMFLTGLYLFLFSSLACGLSFSGTNLIFARVFQGLASALIVSNSIVLIIENSEISNRGRSVGKCIAIASCAGIFGPAIGGFFTYFCSWRALFLINVPIALISIYYTNIFSGSSSYLKKTSWNLDWSGIFTLIGAVLGFTISLMQGNIWGWYSIKFISCIFMGVIFLIAFVCLESFVKNPLMNIKLFKNKRYAAGNFLLLLIQTCDIASAIFWVLYLQLGLGFSPWVSGLLLLPLTIPGIYFSNLSGKLLDKFGPYYPIGIGSLCALLSVGWIASVADYQNYWLILPGFVVYGIGESLIIPATITSLISLAPETEYGLASGVANTMRQIGGSLGLALIGSVITHGYAIQNSTFSDSNQSYLFSAAFTEGMWLATFFALVVVVLAYVGFKKTHSNEILLEQTL